MKLFWVFLFLVVLVVVPFLIAGEYFDTLFDQTQTAALFNKSLEWGWLLGIVLLISDLLLPIPATVVMTTLGIVYGPVWGSLLSFTGSFLSGVLAYEVCRKYGVSAAMRFLGKDDYAKGTKLFASFGGWIIVLTRWLPVFSEVVACFAGLQQMPRQKYLLALAFSSLSMGMTFAVLGSAARGSGTAIVLVNTIAPATLWIISSRIIWKNRPQTAPS